MSTASKAAIALGGSLGLSVFAAYAQDPGSSELRLDRQLTFFTTGQQGLLASREIPVEAQDINGFADLSEKSRADLREIRPDMLDGAPNVLHLRAAGGNIRARCALVPYTLDLRCGTASTQAVGQAAYPGNFQPTTISEVADAADYHRGLNDPGMEVSASYSWVLSQHTAVFGYVGSPGVPALGTPLYRHPVEGYEEQARGSSAYWMDANRLSANVVTLGYVWRSVKVEGSTYRDSEEPRFSGVASKPFSASSGRLSFNPSPDLALKISRGQRSRLDLVDPQEEIRRTTVSAVYSKAWDKSNWQTTLAFGRRARKESDSTSAVLFESVFKINHAHAFFGRFERTAAAELFRENENMYAQNFSADKYTVGYVYEFASYGPMKVGVGALADKRILPKDQIAIFGNTPASYKVFMRVKLRLQ